MISATENALTKKFQRFQEKIKILQNQVNSRQERVIYLEDDQLPILKNLKNAKNSLTRKEMI